MAKLPDTTITYVERNRGKLHAFRIGRGRHVRKERTEAGALIDVHYTDVFSGGTNKILLTKEGAKALKHLQLSPAEADKAIEVKSEKKAKEIEIPEGWADLTPNRKLSLARKIGGKEVTAEQAEAVINEYIKANEDASGDTDSN